MPGQQHGGRWRTRVAPGDGSVKKIKGVSFLFFTYSVSRPSSQISLDFEFGTSVLIHTLVFFWYYGWSEYNSRREKGKETGFLVYHILYINIIKQPLINIHLFKYLNYNILMISLCMYIRYFNILKTQYYYVLKVYIWTSFLYYIIIYQYILYKMQVIL